MSDPADQFTAMAERIARIKPEEFAGAVVIVPPGDQEAIVFLSADPQPDIVGFWAVCETRVQAKKVEVIEKASAMDAFGRRR